MSAYIRWEGTNRETGTRTQVIDTTHADTEFDAERDDNGKVVNRWMVICMDHAMLVTSHNLETALTLSAHPLAWCESCQDMEPTPQEQGVVDQGQANLEAYIAEQEKPKGNVLGLPAKSFEFFVALAEDAPNWSGNPYLSGNVAPGRSSSGMSQTLVRAGLIEVHGQGEDAFAVFTEAGIEAAAKVGITSII